MKRVLIVGSARESAGGVSSVIKLMEKMDIWSDYHCRWIGTQIQRNYFWKLWYAIKGNLTALLIIWRYSIVHMHTTPDKLGLLIQLPILLCARLLGKKIILHIHVGNQLKTKKNALFVFCLKKADLIVLLAKKWENLFAEYYPEVKVKTTVLYNPCENVPDIDLGLKEKIIIMAAFFTDNKAPDLLLKAIKQLRNECYGELEDWKVMMLGNGEVEKYENMTEELGLSDLVSFTGYITGNARTSCFQKASICCICSYEEGFPMIALESWMYGISLITTPVGGLPDVIENGKNCLVFNFGDSNGLAYQLRKLMDDQNMRKEMADYSRPFIREKFSMEIINKNIEEIYKELLL